MVCTQSHFRGNIQVDVLINNAGAAFGASYVEGDAPENLQKTFGQKECRLLWTWYLANLGTSPNQ